jgi:REP element-mobilizing transposase RayT
MARPPRIDRPGAWHHVTARGNERKAIFRDDRDRHHFCQLVGKTVEVFRWKIHAYVLMDNHYHLLIETPEPNLSRGMQWLNVSYCVWFNRRHSRAGHLLQGRFKSIVVDPLGWGMELSRYVHLNPVRIGRLGLDKLGRKQIRAGAGGRPSVEEVKARATELRAYRWSSYRAYAGLDQGPRWLRCDRILELGGGPKEDRSRAYRGYVESAIREGLDESPWEKLRMQMVLGSAQFARKLSAALGSTRQASKPRNGLARPTVEEIISAVENVKGHEWKTFRDLQGDWGRDTVFYIGRKDWGIKLSELGAAGGAEVMAVSMAARRLEAKLGKNNKLLSFVTQCRDKLKMFYV